ncbi:MAG: hypothetical protein ACYS76_09195 [Planctomycetota bacterium]
MKIVKSRIIPTVVLMVVFAGGLVPPVRAAVRFDGLVWYHSEDPDRLILNKDHQLVWVNPRAPDMVIVRLPAMDVSDVGDVAEVAYMFKTEGVRTGVASTDPTLLSGTGDLRIGLFDSNGRGHMDRDGGGYRNEIWCGYLGYHARMCPHLPVGIRRKHSDAIPGKIMKRTKAFEKGVCESLLQKAGPYGRSRDISGFGLPLGVYSPLILRVERTKPNTLVFSATLNDVTYRYVDDDASLQPKKIDALGIYFPNPKAYSSITLAGCCFSCRPSTVKFRPDKDKTFDAYRPKRRKRGK